MLTRKWHHNHPHPGPAPIGARALEKEGHYLLRGAFPEDHVDRLREAIEDVFRSVPPDMRGLRSSVEDAGMFRYEMFNRSAACQEIIGRREILSVIEPLLGEDCHVVSCTAWRNPPGREHAPRGQEWHVDGGPFVPRGRWTRWPRRIPYPIFVVATHIYLRDVSLSDGPTAFVPGSHKSGRLPPGKRIWDLRLRYRGRRSVAHVARAGDVSFFVSDVWHRRLPPRQEAQGRFFLQTNYGRREVAQRVRPTDVVNHASEDAIARAGTPRERQLIGLHPPAFYDG